MKKIGLFSLLFVLTIAAVLGVLNLLGILNLFGILNLVPKPTPAPVNISIPLDEHTDIQDANPNDKLVFVYPGPTGLKYWSNSQTTAPVDPRGFGRAPHPATLKTLLNVPYP